MSNSWLRLAYNASKRPNGGVYIEDRGGPNTGERMSVDHNTFLGPEPQEACEHRGNVWHIWQGGTNNTVTHNLVWGESRSRPQTNPISPIFENCYEGSVGACGPTGP